MDASIARALDCFTWLTSSVRSLVKQDRVAYLQGLASRVTLADVQRPKDLYAAVRRAFPGARAARRANFQALPAVLLADGTTALDPATRVLRWAEYFGEQEAGEAIELADYPQHFSSAQPDPSLGGPHFEIAALPTLQSVEQQILALPARKAVGPDGIAAELLHVSVVHSAAALYPVYLKTALGLREPAAWRGGNLICLAKRASSLMSCSAFRSILLESVPGKLWHRILRSQLTASFAGVCLDLQAGQLPGIGTDSVALAVRSYQQLTKRRGRRCGLVFYDVRAAFYMLLRQTLVPTTEQDATLLGLLDRLAPSAHTTALISDLLRGTWFRMDGAAALILTHRGGRPGDPLADILFAFSFSAYLRAAEQALASKGLSPPVPCARDTPFWQEWEPPQHIQFGAWADDFVNLRDALTGPGLCADIQASTGLITAHASAVGMTLTFAVDKTAALISSDCGRGADLGLRSDDTGQLGLDIHDPVMQAWHFLPVVDSYKHLGGIVTANGTAGTDLSFRFSKAQGALRPLYRRLFSAPDIPQKVRKLLLQALVISRFVFTAASQIFGAEIYKRQWCRMYVVLWRGLLRWSSAEATPHSYEVLRFAAATNPLLALAHMRAVFLRRLTRHGPATLIHLLKAHWAVDPVRSWLGHLHDDLRAVAVYVAPVQALLSAPCPVAAILESVVTDEHWWPRQIKLASSRFADRLEVWAGQRGRTMPSGIAPAPEPTEEDRPFACQWCTARFRLRKHLAAHAAKSHGILCPARHFTPTSTCQACLRMYHSVERACYHTKRSRECLLRLAHLMPPMTLAQIRLADAEEVQRRKKLKKGQWQAFEATTPAQPTFGPRRPTRAEMLLGLDEEDVTLDLLARTFRPKPSVLAWLNEYFDEASREGPRTSTAGYWLQPPSGAPSVSVSIVVSPFCE
ncbi:unnamed protein product [Symbiodinium sp. CCMP2592]|nr:unnamed protein product [Symbiodinium sp. CCMP2592]